MLLLHQVLTINFILTEVTKFRFPTSHKHTAYYFHTNILIIFLNFVNNNNNNNKQQQRDTLHFLGLHNTRILMQCTILTYIKWYDMVYYMIWYMIWYILLTAIGLTSGGSSTVHIYTQIINSSTVHIYTQTIHSSTVHRTTKRKRIHRMEHT
jgi:hypothetical protein